MLNFISEDDIEKALVARLREAGFAEFDCCTERKEDLADGSGRDDKRQVVLPARLRAALKALNPAAESGSLRQVGKVPRFADLAGGAPSNLSRAPKTMERYGLVEMRRQHRQVRLVVKASEFVIRAA